MRSAACCGARGCTARICRGGGRRRGKGRCGSWARSAARGLAGHVGVSAACEALGVARATFYRRRRPKTGQRQPRPAPARALGEAERSEVFEVLCSPRFADRAPAEVVRDAAGRGRLSVFGADDVPRPGRKQGGPGAPGPAQPPEPSEARGGGPRAQRGVVLGHHAAPRAGEVAVLLPLRHPGHLQPLRHGLDGGRPGDRGAGRTPDRGELPEARCPAPRAHASFGPGDLP